MAEAHGQRGHGYFVPLKESKDFIKPYNCPNLPDCEDKAECQGNVSKLNHKFISIRAPLKIGIFGSAFKCLIRNHQ